MWFKSDEHFYQLSTTVLTDAKQSTVDQKWLLCMPNINMLTCMSIQNLIQLYYVVQELWAFSLTDHRRIESHSVYSAHLRVVQCQNLIKQIVYFTICNISIAIMKDIGLNIDYSIGERLQYRSFMPDIHSINCSHPPPPSRVPLSTNRKMQKISWTKRKPNCRSTIRSDKCQFNTFALCISVQIRRALHQFYNPVKYLNNNLQIIYIRRLSYVYLKQVLPDSMLICEQSSSADASVKKIAGL